MKNPNAPINKLKSYLNKRWSGEDYPTARPRFQFRLFAKDVGIFLCLPLISMIIVKSCDGKSDNKADSSRTRQTDVNFDLDSARTQIIDFSSSGHKSSLGGVARRAPGSLLRVRLMNLVETFGNAPVHAQIVDRGLGAQFLGGTLIGDATPDGNYERINITFKYAKPLNRDDLAYSISARALSLDGTLGLAAQKKEGFFARAALGSAQSASQNVSGNTNEKTLRDFLLQAFISGGGQEFNQATQVAKNRSQVLTLPQAEQFFVELTDYFPGVNR